MKIAIIGYGKMGKEIEKIAPKKNHEIVGIFDVNNKNKFTIENLKKADVAIEFTQPDSAFNNFLKCFEADIPIVSGTTGWLDKISEIKKICNEKGKTFFYASNFSLGVNIFFKLNQYLAKLMNNFEGYDVEIEEIHHTEKKDVPSGTAISLAEEIISNLNSKTEWKKEIAESESQIPIHSLRRIKVTGIHNIKYESDVDYIEIKHSAKNRKGFALGAISASEFVIGKKGFFGMDELLKL